MPYTLRETALFEMLAWVDLNSSSLLKETWLHEIKEEYGPASRSVKVHIDEKCERLPKHATTVQVAKVLRPTDTLNGDEHFVAACDSCIHSGFVNYSTLKQAERLYAQYRQLVIATTIRPDMREREVELLYPMRVIGAVKANQIEYQNDATDCVTELKSLLDGKHTRLLEKYDTLENRRQMHAWARRLTLLNKAVCFGTGKTPPKNETFSWFFSQIGTQYLALRPNSELTHKHTDTLRQREPAEEKHVEQYYATHETFYMDTYISYLSEAREGLSIVAGVSPTELSHNVKGTLLWKYLYTNLIMTDATRSIGLYRVDSEMAKWAEYASETCKDAANDPGLRMRVVSETDVANSVLQTALKLWDPQSYGPYRTLENSVLAAEKLLAGK